MDYDDLENINLPEIPQIMNTPTADRANVIEQTNPEPFIQKVKHIWRGEEEDEDGNWVLPEGAEPAMNGLGINEMASFMRMIITKNTIFTKYTREEIYELIRDIEQQINHHLRKNAYRYNLNPHKYSLLVYSIIQPVEAAIKRSQEGITLDFVGNVTKQIISNSEVSRPQIQYPQYANQGIGKRILNKLLPFK